MTDLYKPPEEESVPDQGHPHIRFRFQVEGREVMAEGELSSGRERVFLDGEKVSETRTYGRRSAHEFSIGETPYRIEFFIRNPLVSVIRCSLFREEKELRRQRCRAKINTPLALMAFSALLVLYTVFIYFDARYQWPGLAEKLFGIVLFVLFIVAGHIATVRGRKEIVDEPVE